MLRFRLRIAIAWAVTILAGCGIDVLGSRPLADGGGTDATVDRADAGGSDATLDGTTTVDAQVDAGEDGSGNPGADGGFDAGTCAFACNAGGDGWTPIYFAASKQTSCPGGATPTSVKAYSVVPNPCTCSCGQFNGTCTSTDGGTVALSFGAGCGSLGVSIPNDETCQAAGGNGFEVDAGQTALVVPSLSAPVGSCGSSQSTNAGGITQSDATMCPVPTCPSGCALAPPSGPFQACIQQSGDQTCPSNFSHRTKIASMIMDNRTCSPCTCTSAATCVDAKVSYFNNGACDGDPAIVANATGTCSPMVGQGGQISAYKYTASVANTACVMIADGGSTPSGTVDPSNDSTVCCP